MANKKNVQERQHVDVDKNPMEVPGESLYDKETLEAEKILAKERAVHAPAKRKRKSHGA